MKLKKMFVLLVSVTLSFIVLISCEGGQNKFIRDYYREYDFELPFELVSKYRSSWLYFDAEYTIEQMSQLIVEAGYQAQVHEYQGVKRIFISVIENNFTYYFTIYDKNYLEENASNIYVLRDHGATYGEPSSENRNPWIYRFLFPVHLANVHFDTDGPIKIFGTFDDIANYYRSTGKDDVVIFEEENKIIFSVVGDDNFNWVSGDIVMQYLQDDAGSYINIRPMLQ